MSRLRCAHRLLQHHARNHRQRALAPPFLPLRHCRTEAKAGQRRYTAEERPTCRGLAPAWRME